MLAPIAQVDPEIAELIVKEDQRQDQGIELIASENITSLAVRQAQGSGLTNKYAEGYPHRRYYGGCEVVDEVEDLARDRVKDLFGAEYANVQPHSGSQANMSVYFSYCQPGDTILAMDLAHGGHLTHGAKVSFSGRIYNFVHYGLNPETEALDYDQIRAMAKKHQPKLIVTGASAYSRIIDFAEFRKIADEVGAALMVDMAHISGLVATGHHPSPVPHADFVTSTTHKTLRGPRGGFVLAKAEYGKKINSQVFPGIQGGPLMHVIAAKAVAFKLAAEPEFKDYMEQVVKNAAAMANELAAKGLRLVSGGTDNHMVLVDVTPLGLNGKEAEDLLGSVGITVNKNAIPFDQKPPSLASGLRLGSPAATTRGFKEAEMVTTSRLIAEALGNPESAGIKEKVHAEVLELCKKFPLSDD
ncbi:serine hydroxymethyltransferase [Dethiosulfatarculus sandiegensis]|uniref:Serine hydroxymethyltransferase n=1 Tax=Dethiosulfatarculus sandiegensis TaxID=1429043 RepID=A0A0D2HQJ2_9BACT|nr:serine hydroxymethyltransferase [Dethiosulfatarculus sandiegensis]KIX12748.1 serine hydroxymethyltransferase [Dethiosulfatarculus sandiegensis]